MMQCSQLQFMANDCHDALSNPRFARVTQSPSMALLANLLDVE